MSGCFVGRGIVKNFQHLSDRVGAGKGKDSRRFNRRLPNEVLNILQDQVEYLNLELGRKNLPLQKIYWIGRANIDEESEMVLTLLHRHVNLRVEIRPWRLTPDELLEHLKTNPDLPTYVVEREDLIVPLIKPIRREMAGDGLSCNFVAIRSQGLEAFYAYQIDQMGEEVFYTRWVKPRSSQQVRAGKFHHPVRLT